MRTAREMVSTSSSRSSSTRRRTPSMTVGSTAVVVSVVTLALSWSGGSSEDRRSGRLRLERRLRFGVDPIGGREEVMHARTLIVGLRDEPGAPEVDGDVD